MVSKLLGRASQKIHQQNNADIGANVASGSYPTDAMIVLPCSVGTLARIANGMAIQLIERAADVCLKEQRPLILCVRETPFNRIHLRNMTLAAEAGATIFPVIPAFYFRPSSTDEIAREYVNRVLAHVGLPQPDAYPVESEVAGETSRLVANGCPPSPRDFFCWRCRSISRNCRNVSGECPAEVIVHVGVHLHVSGQQLIDDSTPLR